jgi:hypothetical protein
LLPGQYTPQVHEWLVELSAWMPFAAAVKLLAAMVGVKVSKASAVRATEAAGAAYVAMQDEEVIVLERQAPRATACPERMVVSADGAMVPLLHGEWGEVRTLAIGVATPMSASRACKAVSTASKQPGKTANQPEPPEIHTRDISYFSRLTSAETFTHVTLVETHHRGLENAKQIAAVMDGADWLQRLVDYHCPQAVRILDFAHAAQRISEIGQVLWGQSSVIATSWTQTWTHRLKHEGPNPLLGELRQLQRQYPDNEVLRLNLAYLDKRQSQLQYPRFREQGWPIGSGMIESANKLVVEARLKGAGMHWQRTHVNPMLALRNLVCSDRWSQEWPRIQARIIAQAEQRRAAPHRQRLETIQTQEAEASLAAKRTQFAALHPEWRSDPQPPSPKTAKPGPDHPWRRSPIGRARLGNSPNTKF